jgi:hypothetical protein
MGPEAAVPILVISTKIMHLKTVSAGFLLLIAAHLPAACAACLDPKTGISGYKLPLETEVHRAQAIIIGRVLAERRLQEDPGDPDGITASNFKIKVLKKLKGRLPGVIIVRNENTSSRYPMSVGEEHILFVSRTKREMLIDSCGNSDVLPRGERVLKEIRGQLRASK